VEDVVSESVVEQFQKSLYFNALFTRRMLEEGKLEQLRSFLLQNICKYKNDLTDEEIADVGENVE